MRPWDLTKQSYWIFVQLSQIYLREEDWIYQKKRKGGKPRNSLRRQIFYSIFLFRHVSNILIVKYAPSTLNRFREIVLVCTQPYHRGRVKQNNLRFTNIQYLYNNHIHPTTLISSWYSVHPFQITSYIYLNPTLQYKNLCNIDFSWTRDTRTSVSLY